MLFKILVTKAYNNTGCTSFTLDEVLSIFQYYLAKYEAIFKRPHPNIRMEQIERIIAAMPYLDDIHGSDFYIEPVDYEALIDKHFQTKYRKCDYNINHFFSGDIRMLRFYEECL